MTTRPHQQGTTIILRLAVTSVLAGLSLTAGCAGDPPGHAGAPTPDASTDAAPDLVEGDGPADTFEVAASVCLPSSISEAQATRKSSAASVTVEAVLLNAVDGCPRDVRFKLVLDTHSVPLLAIDLAASARLETSPGVTAGSGFRWMGTSESDHHREGVLSVTAPTFSGSTPLRLTLLGIAGVDRTFEWDASLLGWARRP